jgi:hypothetical protein
MKATLKKSCFYFTLSVFFGPCDILLTDSIYFNIATAAKRPVFPSPR